MIAKMFDATARHRRPILLGGVVVAVIEATLTARNPFGDARPAWQVVVPVLLLFLAVTSFRRVRPTAFVVRPDLMRFTGSA